ncbi:MAG TPA: alpha-E domain-containing protein, partial [Acidimicrobiales bacterium]|nr:alpha-E domain-containing protein [Acidimicrobiales bacterium]
MLLSRMAETVYWAGRYLERAETTARVVQVHGETHFDLPLGADVGWEPLLELFGAAPESSPPPGRVAPEGGGSVRVSEDEVVTHVLTDLANPSSALSSLAMARANLRDARPIVPREAWEVLHNLWACLRADAPLVVDRDVRVGWLRRIVEECQRLAGVFEGSMRRDEAFAFLHAGQQVERADMTCRVLAARAREAVGTSVGDSYRDAHRMAILRSLCAYHPFRRAVTVQPDSASLLRFLVQDQRLPHSVNVALAGVADQAKTLPNSESVLTACSDASVGVAGASFPAADELAVRAQLQELLRLIDRIHEDIVRSYFGAAGTLSPGTGTPGDEEVSRPGTGGRRSTASGAARARIPGVDGARTLRVTHVTTYDYDGPVEHSYNEAHLCPRELAYQRRLSHDLEIEPAPNTSSRYTDPFGNTVVTFGVAGGFERMSVIARSDVVVTPRPPPPVGV